MKFLSNIIAAFIIIAAFNCSCNSSEKKLKPPSPKIPPVKNGGKKPSFINSIQEVLKIVMAMVLVILKASFQN
jgi:hypothetical protein